MTILLPPPNTTQLWKVLILKSILNFKRSYNKKPKLKLIARKPITAGEEELERNPRARSAKLRVAERLQL